MATKEATNDKPLTVYARLVEAKKAFKPAEKNAKNPHLKNKYADLSSVLEAVTDALNAQGLIIHQVVTTEGLQTMIVDIEGSFIDFGTMPILASKQDAQGYGSGLTYARRYGVMNACGIAPEDDDGAGAVKTAPNALQEQRPQPTPRVELLSAGITSLVTDLKKNAGIQFTFWGERYGKSTNVMSEQELTLVSADIKAIKSNFNGIEFIQPFEGFN